MNEWFRAVSEPVDAMPVDLSLPGVECFLPVAIICGFCVLATVVWMVSVQKHFSQERHARQDQSARRYRPG